jgi:hypothetical protein
VPERLDAEIVPVVANAPFDALYVSAPSVRGESEPVALSYMAMNDVASVESVTVTVDASVARSIVILFGISASVSDAHVRSPLAAIVVAKVFDPQSLGLEASAVAVEELPVRAPTKVVDVTDVNPAIVVAVAPRAMFVEPTVSEEFARLELASNPATSAVARSIALVVEPEPMNILDVRVSDICESESPVIDERFPVVMTVPVASGNVIVLSDVVGSANVMSVSIASAVLPSAMRPVVPNIVALAASVGLPAIVFE